MQDWEKTCFSLAGSLVARGLHIGAAVLPMPPAPRGDSLVRLALPLLSGALQ